MNDDEEPHSSQSNSHCSSSGVENISSLNNITNGFNGNQNNLTGLYSSPGSSSCIDSSLHNDCGKHCTGAKPKPKHLTCNIPNGTAGGECSRKVNNIANGDSHYRINSDEANLSAFDSYVRNNVDSQQTVDKCPPKVGNCVDDDSSSGNEDEYCIYTYKEPQDRMADLPSSFYQLNVGPPREEVDRNSSPDMDYLEMDFDPGPSYGLDSEENSECSEVQPANDQNMSNSDIPLLFKNLLKSDNQTNNLSTLQDCGRFDLDKPSCSRDHMCRPEGLNVNKMNNDSSKSERNPNLPETVPRNEMCQSSTSTEVSQRVEEVRDTKGSNSVSPSLSADALPCSSSSSSLSYRLSKHSADLYSPGESWSDSIGELSPDSHQLNLNSALYHCVMAKRLILDKQSSFVEPDLSNLNENGSESPDNAAPAIEQTMIWAEQEAARKQTSQLGVSACGATAVINAMVALGVHVLVDKVKAGVNTRFRADCSPLPEYLFSRSVAGASHFDLIRGLHHASNNLIYAKFFHMYPKRNICLSSWLASWIKKGAVPILTLNLQAGGAGTEADWWHHQMVYGVGSRGVFLTNPLSCRSEATLLPQLSSPSILLIRRSDIISRWSPDTDLRPLTRHQDPLWKKLNVLGQVVNVLRQHARNENLTKHISIPAVYRSGVTLAALRDSPAGQELMHTPEELPLFVKASSPVQNRGENDKEKSKNESKSPAEPFSSNNKPLSSS